MLEELDIAGFRRIGLLQLKFRNPITLFFGHNEAGKSSIAEAVRFALVGASTRYAKKGDYQNLVTYGKKKGVVKLVLNGLEFRRELPSGKLTSAGTIDVPELLIDIQLGAETFSTTEKDGILARRKMLNELLKLDATEDFITQRLQERGVSGNIIDKVVPLVRGGNFQAAEEEAKSKASQLRGQWEELTGEKYGSVKADGWKPEDLSRDQPTEKQIAEAERAMQAKLKERDDVNYELGSLSERFRQFEAQDKDAKSIEEWELEAANAKSLLEEHTAILREVQDEYREETERRQTTIHELELKLAGAKAAAATLVCPCCNVALNIVSREDATVLVQAETDPKAKNAASDVSEYVTAIRQAKQELENYKREGQVFIEGARNDVAAAQISVAAAEAGLASAKSLAAVPRPTEDELTKKAEDFARVNEEYESAQHLYQDLVNLRNDHVRQRDKTDRAAGLHRLIAMWSDTQKAFSNDADSIPSELAMRLMRPINEVLARIAEPWGQVPIALEPSSLKLHRIDQTPYQSLSESAQWRANAMMQLALATISPLKLVVLDRFDVLVASERSKFMDGLDAFSQEHPEISILVMGSLKEQPKGEMEGFSMHWVENGGIAA